MINQVLKHHLDAFLQGNVNEIMKDYTAESSLYTPQGEIKGLEGIRGFFEYVFSLLPQESFKFNMVQQIIFDDYVYLAFDCSSSLVDVPLGTDTFKIRDGKILWQTLAAHIVQK
jgi:hypothetical protein